MKQLMGVLTAAVMLLSLAACGTAPKAQADLYIEKAELTEEEQAILDFVGSEAPPYILHYSVDDTVRSLQINTYELRDGAWDLVAGGGGQMMEEPEGRIALTFDHIGLGLRTAVEHCGSNRYETLRDLESEGLSTTTSYLTDKTPVVYEQEIPLVIQIHTSQDTVVSLFPEEGFARPEDYTARGYEQVYAITCRFSQKSVGEVTAETAE